MKRITKILILVVAAVLMTSLFMSCKKDKGDDSGGQTVNPLGSSIFEVSDIKTAAQNGLNRAYYDTSGISTHAVLPKRFVDSEYEILFNKANLTITYQANYTASSEEDSLIDKDAEILLRIKDNNDINNKLFVYYNGNDLYTEVNGVRSYQKNFSAEPTYELFYSIITTFDVGQFYFFNRNWESVDDPWAVDEANGNKLSSFYEYYAGIINGVDFNTISVTAVQEKNADGSNKKLADITSPYAITIANATLDNGKTAINKILTGTVRDYIGKRLDALTLLGFGFKLSDIGNAGIGRLDCEEASMSFIPRATDGQAKVNAILLDFSGYEANNVDRFKIHIYYEEKPLGDLDKGTIGITQYDVNKNYAVNERLAGTYEKADLTVANYFNTPKKLSEAPIEGTLLYNALANAVRNNESPRTILSTLMPVSSISKDTIARLRDEGKLINETDIFLDEDGNIPSWAVNAILLRSGTARTNDGKTVDMRFCEDETILELVQKGEVIYKYNDYRISFGGEYSYTGTLYVDAWEAEFSAAIRAVIDPKNENRDQFLIDFRSKSPDFVVADGGSEFDTFHDDQVAFLYYNYKPEGTPDGDKKLYINIEGLVANYLGEPGLDGNPPKSPFAFGEMNLPKAYTDGFDFHKFVNSVLSNASTIVLIRNNMFNTAFNQGSAESTSYLFNIVRSEPTLYALVDSIIMHSQSNGTKFSFTIDKDLLKAIENLQNTAQELLNQTNNNAIEAANYVKYVAEFISETIGLDVGAVNALIESGIFDEIHLVLSYDFSDSLITVETFNGTTRFFILSLYEDSQNEQMLNITPPKYFSKDLYDYVEFDSAEYERYAPAEVLRLHFEGEMGVQGDVPADMSELLGIFLGDGTGANSEFIIRGGDRMYLETEIWQDNGETMLFLSLWYNPVLLPGSYGKIQYTRADIDNAATPPILRVYSAEDDHECFYVEIADAYFRKKADLALGESLIPLSYKINRQSVYDALQISLGDASLFSTNAIADIYSVLQRDARTAITGEYMSLSLSPYEVNGRIYDPILSIFGVENINANMRAKVFFSRPEIIQTVAANYTEPFEFDKASYAEPVIDSLEDMAFKSKYTAYFAKDIEVYFGDLTLEYKLSFVGRTAEFSTDIYRYKPEAYLFGQTATYSMIITDTANGTRDLTGVASRYAVYKDGVFDGTYAYELDSIVIDPLDDVPIPTFIAVYYDLPSGQRIYDTLEFIIQGFPYTNATVKAKLDGEAPNAYTIKIGKGSVSEIDFVVNIEIKNRRIQLVNESLEGQAYADALAKSYINGIPIIEHLTIDPVEFSQRRITDPTYDPLAFYRESPRVEETRIISGVPTVVVTSSLIQFMSTSGELRENVYIGTRSGEWNEPTHVTESFSTTEEYGIFDFDLSNISYNGGRFYVYAKWKSLKMAIEINVAARVVDYIKIEGEISNRYTVDSLIVATYIIPSVSTSEREVRVYFKKGDGEVTSPYVVIAPTEGYTPKAAGVNERLIGIYSRNAFGLPDLTPGIFNWRYTSATVTNTEAAAKPLRDGLYATDTDTALFGDRELGYQTVSLVVDVPSRRLPGGTTRTNVITNITTVGEIDNEILNSVTPSYVRFPGGAYGEGISLSPQDVGNGAVLPQTVTARYVGSGGGDAVDKTYTITWNASFFNDADGVFIKRIAREALVRVTGTIGDGTVKETVTLIVENGNKTFASLKAYGSFDPVEETRFEFETARLSDGNYSLNLDPYRYDYLPQTLEINFGTFSETFNFTNADWYYLYEGEYAKIEDVGGRGVFGWAVDGVTYYIRVQLEADPEARYLAQAVTFEIILSNREIKRDRIYGLLPNGAGWTQGIPFDGAAANAKAFENAILAAEYVEVEFATAARGKNVAVKWLNLEEVLEWLRSPQGTGFDGSDIIKKDLIGVVCEGIPSLEQQINISIQVIPRTINAISFGGISDVLINSGIIEYRGLEDYITNLNNGSSDSSIEIVVKKPYALINYLNYALDLGEFGLDISFEESYDGFLSLAFAQLLTDFSLVYRYQQFNLEPRLKPQLLYGLSYYAVDDLINMLLIEDSKTEHIRIATMGAGSMLMPIVFEYTVIRDAVITGGGDLIEYIDVLGADGSFMYPEKFEMPKTIAVMYQNSGIVSYDVRKWNLVLSVGEGMNQDDEIAEIGSEYYFEGGALLVGNKVLVRTNPLLHSSSEGNGNGYITLELRFYSKNIRNTNYKAAAPAAASLQYAISAGTITISNIYEIYPFNPDNVPRLITPVRNTQFYDFSGEGQTFDITKRWTTEDDETAVPHDWVWDAYFLTNGQFDPSKINAFGLARRRLATAIIEVAGVFQEIYLDIQVTAFTTDTVIDGEYVFDRSLEVQGRFTRELSMYSDGFGGNYILPQDITVRSGATQYTFRADDNRLKYYLDPSFAVINGQNIIKIIPYGWDGNYIPGTTYDEAGNISSISLAGSSGVSSAGIPLILELPDGILVNLLLTVKHEELQGVAYKNTVKDGQDAYFASPRNPNGALAVQQGTYYLDPYYSDSYVLPASVRAYFTGGAYLDLSVGTLKDGSGLDILQAGNILYNAETQQYSFTQEYVNWCIANANTEILYNASLSYYGGYPEKYQTYRMRVVIVDRGLRELESEVVNPLLVSREFLEKQATDYLHANFASLSAPEYSILNLAEISVSFDIQNSALLNETYGTFAGGAEREIFGRVTGTLKTSAVVENETVITSHVTEGIQIVKRISAKKLVFAGLTGIEENAQGVIINSEIPLDYHLTIDPYTANAIPNKYMVHFSDGSALSGIVAYTIPFASKAEADSYLIVNGEFTDEAIGYGYDKTDRLFIFLGSSSLTSEERYELGVIRDIKIGTGYNGDYSYACSGVGAVQITGGGTVVAGAGYVFYFTAIEVLEINIYPEYSALPGLDVPGVLVIDPLNPHIPTVVQAKVREVANIGTEIVSWTMLSVKFIPYEPFTPAIDDFTQLPTNSGAVTRRYIASLSGADQNSNAIIDDVLIDVIYLDRRYMQVYMPDFTIQDEYGMPDIRSYSTLSTYEQQFNNAEGKLLRKIYDRTSSVPWTFSLDPLRSYDYYTQKNIIPVSLTAAFRADYTDSGLNAEVIPLVNALVNDRYGYIADITDIDWGDLSERIRLFSTVQGEFYNINASFTRDFRISVKVDGVYGAPQRKKLDNNREFGYSNYTLIARVPVYELEIPFAGALQYNSQNEMFFAAYTQGVGYDDYTIDPYAYILHQNANHIYPYGDDLRSDRIKINLTRDITILYDITENGINDYLAFMRQPTNGSFAAEIAVRAVLRDAYKQYTGNLAISEAAFNALDLTNLAKEGFFAYLKAAFVPEKMLATYYIYYNAGYDSTDLNAAAARGSLSQKDKADIVKYKEFVLSEKARTERVRYAFDLYTRVFNDIREAAGKPLFAGDYVRLRDNINEAELTAFREYTRLYGDEISVNGGNSFFREVFDLGYFQIRYGVRGGLKTAINVGSSLLKDAPWVGSDRNMQGSATVLNGGAVMFYFEFFGTRVPILFQLKSSPISNLNIQGGDIYVLEGEDILPQLPKSILYSINGEMREVPVTFSGYDINGDYYASPEFSTVTGIDSDRRSGYPKVVASGTYNIRAMLGIFEKNNIYFNLVVIKPTLQNFLNNVVLTDGDFYTGGGGAYYTKFEKGAPDEEYLSGISLAILNGNYAQGAERAIFVKNAPIEGGFGDRLLYIEDFIIVKEGNDYFMDLYAFYDANLMGNPSVGTGNHDETRILCWRIPVATYVATMLYSGTVSIEQSQIESPLGAEINVSKLPKAKNSSGELFPLMWDLGTINTNRAGTYVARGWYVDNTGTNRSLALTIVVKRRLIALDLNEDGDYVDENEYNLISIDSDYTSRAYQVSEFDILPYITIAPLLRDSGAAINMPVSLLKIEYASRSVANGITEIGAYSVFAPTNAGLYSVRLTIDEYNYYGSVAFNYEITKKYINLGDGGIYMTFPANHIPAVIGSVNSANGVFQYGEAGHENIIGRDETVWIYFDGTGHADLEIVGVPHDAVDISYSPTFLSDQSTWFKDVRSDRYRITVSILSSSPNYTGSSIQALYYILIRMPEAEYSVSNVVYNGFAQKPKINGFDPDLEMTAEYVYWYENEITHIYERTEVDPTEAGTYLVQIHINGGTNMPSAYIPESANPSISGEDNEMSVSFTIEKKSIAIDLKTVRNDYFAAFTVGGVTNPLSDSLTRDSIIDAYSGQKVAITESDFQAILSGLRFYVTEVNMTTDLHLDPATSLHLYGTYELHAEIIGGNNFRNFEFDNSSIHTGLYVIEPKSQSGVKAEMITSQSELQQRLAMVEDGKTYKLFLAPGAYGDLILNKNASIEIVGAYFAGTSGIVENISVKFNSITVNSGSLTLDSIRIDAHAVSYNPAGYLSLPGYGLLISSGAGNVSIQRTYFANNNQAIIVNSVAIIMNTGYANKLTVQNSKISGHANGILARSGNLDIENTIIDGNIIGINIAALQSLRLNRNSISHNSEDGLLIYSQITGEVILIVNDFRSNGVAVRTKHNFGATEQEAMLNLSENTFLLNGLNVKLL